jgi:hypothetical protein
LLREFKVFRPSPGRQPDSTKIERGIDVEHILAAAAFSRHEIHKSWQACS